MESLSIQYLFDKKIVNKISPLQLDSNNSYFITLFNLINKSIKLFFTDESDLFLEANYKLGDDISDLLQNSDIIQISFANPKHKYRIYLSKVRAYTGLKELSDTFGTDDSYTENFDFKNFKKLFE